MGRKGMLDVDSNTDDIIIRRDSGGLTLPGGKSLTVRVHAVVDLHERHGEARSTPERIQNKYKYKISEIHHQQPR